MDSNDKLIYKKITVSPDEKVSVVLGFAISEQLSGSGTNFTVGIKDSIDKEVPVIMLSGEVEMIRPQLHTMIDEWFDSYVDIKRPKSKSENPEDSKAFVWMPKNG